MSEYDATVPICGRGLFIQADDLEIEDQPDFSTLVFQDQDDDSSSETSKASMWFDTLSIIWDGDIEFSSSSFVSFSFFSFLCLFPSSTLTSTSTQPSTLALYQEGTFFKTLQVQNSLSLEELLLAAKQELKLQDERRYKVIKVNHLGEGTHFFFCKKTKCVFVLNYFFSSVTVSKKPGILLQTEDAFDRFFLLEKSKMVCSPRFF